ncbi:MAG: hypothetical protein Q4C65_02570 [Eubacteriales bacterium]|nr:hypothetical protein [Eubacteriales bacterium]
MSRDSLENLYFEWLFGLVCGDMRYKKLCMALHRIAFTYTNHFDKNRTGDGIDCRYRFENATDESLIILLKEKPCSVFEMMAGLAIRCEEQIMADPEAGDRTKVWFLEMVESLGFTGMDNLHFDRTYVEKIVGKFLNRDYSPSGKGGLFTVRNCKIDMRNVEIWYQMCYYLDSIL